MPGGNGPGPRLGSNGGGGGGAPLSLPLSDLGEAKNSSSLQKN